MAEFNAKLSKYYLLIETQLREIDFLKDRVRDVEKENIQLKIENAELSRKYNEEVDKTKLIKELNIILEDVKVERDLLMR